MAPPITVDIMVGLLRRLRCERAALAAIFDRLPKNIAQTGAQQGDPSQLKGKQVTSRTITPAAPFPSDSEADEEAQWSRCR
jgi:hypothetical protein